MKEDILLSEEQKNLVARAKRLWQQMIDEDICILINGYAEPDSCDLKLECSLFNNKVVRGICVGNKMYHLDPKDELKEEELTNEGRPRAQMLYEEDDVLDHAVYKTICFDELSVDEEPFVYGLVDY